MIKTNYLAIIILIFFLIAILLSIFNIIDLSSSEILSYLMITVGAILIYSETLKQNKLLIFLGAIILLLGIYFIITENFEVQMNRNLTIPIILIFSGSGLLVVYITTSTKKYFLAGSVILLLIGLILLVINSHSEVGSFIQSLLPVINFLWPISLIILILILLLRIK